MTSLVIPLALICSCLAVSALHRRARRPTERLEAILTEVEAASALVIADWPDMHIAGRLEYLQTARVHCSAMYKQGLHSANSREADYVLLQRIGRAERRLRTARELQRSSLLSADGAL